MENNSPSISQYLISTCLLVIDEMNESYKGKSKEELKKIANEKFNEMDITVRLGNPFGHMVHYSVGDKGNKNKNNHDLFIESKDFIIEVKFPKNWKSGANTSSNSKGWSEYQKDFDWLISEIDAGNKHKRAFVIGWFNCAKYFSQLIQLGSSSGSKPFSNELRTMYFPFLKKNKVSAFASDLEYNYSWAYKEIPMNLIGNYTGEYNCIFLGNDKDCFHFAIYY
jgi:hypothetical protein